MRNEASVKQNKRRKMIGKWILLIVSAIVAGVVGVFLFASIKVSAAEDAVIVPTPLRISQSTAAAPVEKNLNSNNMATLFLSHFRLTYKTMYLTFDDGPSKENTDKVLDVLKEKNVKATFFVIGEYVRKYPDTARRIVEEGHTIGIHCDVHDYSILYANKEAYLADFEKAYDTVYQITGVKAKLFRFPGGSVNAYNKQVCGDIVKELEARGFIYFDWNASLEDTVGNKSGEQLLQSANESVMGRERIVMLAHDRVENTADNLGTIIDAFPEYRMRPLNEYVSPIHFRRFWE